MTLTNRQHQTARLARLGYTNREIANCMGIQPGTVKINLEQLYRKLDLNNRAHLAAWYVRENTGRNGK